MFQQNSTQEERLKKILEAILSKKFNGEAKVTIKRKEEVVWHTDVS